MKVRITKYEEELVAQSRRFLDAADANLDAREVLEKYGYVEAERVRGRELVEAAERAFAWEREGKAWSFISPTPEKRLREAKDWHTEAIRRFLQGRVKAAEVAAGLTVTSRAYRWPLRRKLTEGLLLAARELIQAGDPQFWIDERAEFKKNLVAAAGDRPEGAPPPKDTVIVELRGWYERWHLLAHRLFRGRNDLLAPFGLVSGKAPPRLRGKVAQKMYGEGAGAHLGRSLPVLNNEPPQTAEEYDDADDVHPSALN